MSDGRREISARAAATAVGILLLVAACLRLQGLDWDQGQHLHPDERFLTMVETAISFPGTFAEFLDTAHSSLNPANRGYRFFVYGTLPLFLVRGLGSALGAADYGHVHLVGRAVSAAFDLGTVWLAYAIGALIAGRRVGLLACALMAFSVTSIQSAHFFTVDSAGTFFATAALLASLRFARDASVGAEIAFGVLFACAVGCRINLALLGIVFPAAFVFAWRRRGGGLARLTTGAVVSGIACALTFRLVQPYAFAGPGFFDLTLAPTFLASLREIRGMVAGEVHFPPSVQWIGRVPILFPARNLLVWGIGPAWGAAAVAGIAFGLSRRASHAGGEVALGRGVLVWGLLFFAYHAWQFAPTGRYFLPIVPVMAVAAGWALGAGRERWRQTTAGLVVLATASWAFAFSAVHRRPTTRVEASRWMYANVPSGKTIAIEHWDDGLPLGIRDVPRVSYRTLELRLYDDDTESKREALLDQLAATDYVVLSSNRLYRSIPREPWRYPVTRRYYELLFSGELGFRLVRSFTSYPRLGPLEIPDDGAEEAFSVYDHPRVLIFEKSAGFSREHAAQLLGAVSLANVQTPSPVEASRLYRRMQPSEIAVPDGGSARVAIAPHPQSGMLALARWLVTFELLSLAVFALLQRPFSTAPDRGFGMAKLIAWLAPGYFTWLLGSSGLAASGPPTARAVAAAIAAAGAIAAWRRRESLRMLLRVAPRELLLVEATFLVAFAVFALGRALNPAIFWGEKPMDFAILNALLRARGMPPPDPWFAGGTLNYFYFGHALVACFAHISGVVAELAFNLAIPTVAGLLAVASFGFGRRVGGGPVGGVCAAFAVTMLGNLDGVRLIVARPHRPFDFDFFWETSRVIEHTINEFPAWNLLFGDLHAHVLAQPLEVALLLVGACWATAPRGEAPPRPLLAALAGWLMGAVSTTSTWSIPCVVALQLAFLVTAWREERRLRARTFVAAIGWWIAAVALSRLLYWPFWTHYRQPVGAGAGFGWETGRAPLADVLTIFGAFWIVLVPVLLARLARFWRHSEERVAVRRAALGGAGTCIVACIAIGWFRSPAAALFAGVAVIGAAVWIADDSWDLRIVGLLVGVAGGLGLVTEVVYAWDRMNTVFKFYLQAWLLLGCAAGAVVPIAWRCRPRWRRAWVMAAAAAAVAGVFTTVSGAAGLLRSPFVPSGVPTLDGMNYLERTRPHEREAFRWLGREVSGVPVLLEAQGDSYGEFARVSMNTGLPTVLGWEYHLFQQSHSWKEIHERRDDVRALYSTTDLDLAARLMKKYSIDLVFVGGLERRTYPAEGLAKFGAWPLTAAVFRRGDVTIYATPGLLSADKTWVEATRPSPAPRSAQPFGSFSEPRDIARAVDGTFWVADFGNGRIQHLDARRKPMGGFGAPGKRPAQFHDPCGVAVGADGLVYVADTWNHRVQKLDAGGRPLAEWRAGFYGPRAVALDRLGSIFVADTGNDRVVRLGKDGRLELAWGKEKDVLRQPVGIAVGPGDEVYVADAGHRRIVVFSRDGELRRHWPVAGWNPTAIVEPHLDVGPDGTVWVTDPSEGRVWLFDSQGKAAGVARAMAPLAIPVGIAVIDADHAVVTNAGSHSLSLVSRTANTSVVPPR